MIHVGDKIKRRVGAYDPEHGAALTKVTVEATVVYIHPQQRFYVLRYNFGPGRSYCESEYFT